MKKHLLYLTLLTALFIGTGNQLSALPFQDPSKGTEAPDPGRKMNFQGTLYENGQPVNGNRTMTFSITVGENTWTETKSIQVIEGLYSTTLGSETLLPEELFYDVIEREMTISVGNNTLGTIKLFAPFSPKEIGPTDDLPRRISINNENVESDTVFYFNISAENVSEGSQRGIQVDMTGVGSKIALRGNTLSQEGDDKIKIAVLGSATGNGIGNHEGVRGQAFGAGPSNAGVLGLAGGPGNGATGYEEGSYNTGVVGYGQSNSWGNTGVSGWAVGSVGVDNIGVAGISSVGSEGDTQVENKGILGRAEGLGINKAIWGRAINGVENWAGWFEGDVAVRNGGNLNLYGPNEGDSLRVQLNYYEPNASGSVLTFGHNNTRRALIGSDPARTGGLLSLYDSLDRATVQIRGTSRPGDWVADKRPHGQMTLWGPESQNFYLGSKVWEEDGANLPVFQLFGRQVENTENPENTTPFEGIFMSVQDNGDGQQGMIQLGKEGEGIAILDFDKLSNLLALSGSERYNLDINEEDAGRLQLFSPDNQPNVLLGSNGPKAGLLNLNDSLGRAAYRMLSYPQGSAYMEMSAGIPEIGETRVVYQHAGYMNPWSNMIARNADGTAKGRVQSGWLSGGGEDFGQFRISDASNRTMVSIHGNETLGGRILLEGPNSSNFFLGGKEWENSDLAFFAMRGAAAVDDGNGGTYFPDLFTLNINQKDGVDYTSLDMNNSSLSSINLGVKSWEDDGLKKPIFQMASDYEESDGNGGTYRPSLIDAQVNISGANTYSGDFNLKSSVGTGIRMYGAADFNNNGVDVYSHIALDGQNGEHVWLNGNGSGEFSGSVSAFAINQTSDARLKKDVKPLLGALAKVNSLRGVRYNWIDENKPENKIGFIAQEVEKVLPELVVTKTDGYKAVNYAEMSAVLVEAVKELQQQIEDLKKENTTLKAELSGVKAMEERLAKIEALLGSSTQTTQSTDKK